MGLTDLAPFTSPFFVWLTGLAIFTYLYVSNLPLHTEKTDRDREIEGKRDNQRQTDRQTDRESGREGERVYERNRQADEKNSGRDIT